MGEYSYDCTISSRESELQNTGTHTSTVFLNTFQFTSNKTPRIFGILCSVLCESLLLASVPIFAGKVNYIKHSQEQRDLMCLLEASFDFIGKVTSFWMSQNLKGKKETGRFLLQKTVVRAALIISTSPARVRSNKPKIYCPIEHNSHRRPLGVSKYLFERINEV